MKVSYQKNIINPDLPVLMDGYNQRVSNKINDDIEVRSFLFEGEETILIHVLDVLLITKDLSRKFKAILTKKFNLKSENIIIIASHTHSGPKIARYLFSNIEPSKDYLEVIQNKLIENTKGCLANVVEAKASYGTILTEGLYSNRTDKRYPYNNELLTIQFCDNDSNPLFQIVNIACHPTVLNPESTLLSSDIFGSFRKIYEKETNIPIVVIAGEAGDVSTRYTRQASDYNEILRIGRELARKLAEIKDYEPISLRNLTINTLEYKHTFDPSQEVYLETTIKSLKEQLDSLDYVDENNAVADFLSRAEKKAAQTLIREKFTSKIIETDEFRMVTFPGEVVTALGTRLRNASDKKMFLAAYADDFKGYAINKEAYGKIPETNLTDFPYGVADDFINEIIKRYKKSVL